MKKLKLFVCMMMLAFLATACGGCSSSESAEPENPSNGQEQPVPETSVSAFAKGADISWVTEMESNNQKFYDTDGKQTDCFQLMKNLGLDAIRLRVWVDPKEHGNWCNTADLVDKAKRAAALGMDVMIDFHYSDWWADPGKQYKPASWKGLNLTDLKKAIYNHSADVMKALKSAGVTPKWVQVGNEIRPGMIWDEKKELSGASYDVKEGSVVKYPMNWSNLAAFVNEGYNAVKSVFKEAIVIVHLDNGYDQGLYDWFFDELKKNGGKWDMIGMSIYPYWTMQSHKEYTAEKTITDCIANINHVSAKYNCDVMIVETGMECADNQGKLADASVLQSGKNLLARLIQESRDKTNGRCKGVFYWEPQCKPSMYRLGAFTEDGRPTAIMEAFK